MHDGNRTAGAARRLDRAVERILEVNCPACRRDAPRDYLI
jgi:hypothetical protein